MTDDKLEAALEAFAVVCAEEIGGGVVLVAFPAGAAAAKLQVASVTLGHMEEAAVRLLDFIRAQTADAGCPCAGCKAALARVDPALAALRPDTSPNPDVVH